jgi:hypothetical protein
LDHKACYLVSVTSKTHTEHCVAFYHKLKRGLSKQLESLFVNEFSGLLDFAGQSLNQP